MGRALLHQPRPGRLTAGYSLSEVLVATAISGLVIGSAGLALQSQLRSIRGSSALIAGRDSNSTGLALLRSEIMRGDQLLFRQGSSTDRSNLDSSNYAAAMTTCQGLAGSQSFQATFGISTTSSTVPTIYGLSIGSNGTSYALRRCGPAIGGSSNPVLSTVLEGIAPMPCGDGRSRCAAPSLDAEGNAIDLPAKLAGLSHSLGSDNTSPVRTARQPAFRFRTDSERRQLELIDPSGSDDAVSNSFTSSDPTGVSLKAPLYLSARVLQQPSPATTASSSSGSSTCIGCSFFGLPIRSSGITFILDGSESMATCTTTIEPCPRTRMQLMQQQISQVLNNVSDSTLIQIVVRSNEGSNDRSWPSSTTWATIGAGNQRAEAIAFINSLSNGNPETWGTSSNPFAALEASLKNPNIDNAYVVLDDPPDRDCLGNNWGLTVYINSCLNTIISLQSSRAHKASIHSLSIGLESNWLRTMSINNYGTYLKI